MAWFESLRRAFGAHSQINEDFYEELEETLILSDVGAETAMQIVERLRKKVKEQKLKEPEAVRELLRQDAAHLDGIQAATASAREFAFLFRMEQKDADADRNQFRQLEKRIHDLGFRVRLAEEQDVKRLLAVYYQQDVTTEWFEDYDGERTVTNVG